MNIDNIKNDGSRIVNSLDFDIQVKKTWHRKCPFCKTFNIIKRPNDSYICIECLIVFNKHTLHDGYEYSSQKINITTIEAMKIEDGGKNK